MSGRAHVTQVFRGLNGKRWTINMDFRIGGTATDWLTSDLNAINNGFYDGFDGSPAVDAMTPDTVEYIRSEAYAFNIVADTSPGTHPPFKRQITLGPVGTTGAAKNGSRVGSILPPQCAVVYTFRTNLSSRRTRGRVYFPPPLEADVDGAGNLVTTYQNGLETALNDWIVGAQNAAPVTVTYQHIVVSLMGGPAGTTADAARDVTSRLVASRLDTQRRRLAREVVV